MIKLACESAFIFFSISVMMVGDSDTVAVVVEWLGGTAADGFENGVEVSLGRIGFLFGVGGADCITKSQPVSETCDGCELFQC